MIERGHYLISDFWGFLGHPTVPHTGEVTGQKMVYKVVKVEFKQFNTGYNNPKYLKRSVNQL